MSRPAAKVTFRTEGQSRTRLRVLAYGEDDRVPNPGDLLIVATMGDTTQGAVEMTLLLAGRDMAALLPAIQGAVKAYAENADWLQEPMTQAG